jgi:hypothetical protein
MVEPYEALGRAKGARKTPWAGQVLFVRALREHHAAKASHSNSKPGTASGLPGLEQDAANRTYDELASFHKDKPFAPESLSEIQRRLLLSVWRIDRSCCLAQFGRVR